MNIEICTHAYAVDLPQYACFLRVQLESLLQAPEYVSETVCYTRHDGRVAAVLEEYVPLLGPRLRTILLTREELGRRGLGRNMAALATKADLVWFADVDYFWGPGCFEFLAGMADNPTLRWPKTVWTQADERVGDALLAILDNNGNPAVDTSDFIATHPKKAIGGIQIIAGDYCRRYGYLNHDKRRQRPLNPGDTMFKTLEDSAIRKHIATVGQAMAIDLPGVYRLRHTRNAYQYPNGRP
jgi:hypothetical protein